MQYYAVLDFHLPLKAGSVYGFMYACCIYSRNIEGCYSEFSYIEKVDLGCEKGKHVEIPFLFWIQLRDCLKLTTKRNSFNVVYRVSHFFFQLKNHQTIQQLLPDPLVVD